MNNTMMKIMKNIGNIIKHRKLEIFIFIFMLALGVFLLYPLFFAVLGSVATKAEFEAAVFLPAPLDPFSQLGNYVLLFKSNTGFLRSIIIVLIRVVWNFSISSAISLIGGYVFARYSFPCKRIFFMFFLGTMMVPGVALMIPNYIWLVKFPFVGGNNILGNGGRGFIDNPLILFYFGWVSVYSIFLFRQSFNGVGKSLGESAEIDGANFFYIVFRIYTPLVGPILILNLLNSINGTWNDYGTDLIYLTNRPDWWSVTYKAMFLIQYYSNPYLEGGQDLPKVFAVFVTMMFPPILLFVLLQRKFVEGLTAGALKG